MATSNSPINNITIHCSASAPSTFVDVKVIDRWHRLRGFAMVGYHYVILRNGDVQVGRTEDQIGAHVEGHNKGNLGVCLVGGVNDQGKSEDNFTDEQYHALALLLQDLLKKYPKAEIKGHRDWAGVKKDCPCFDVRKWWHDTMIDPLGESK